MDISTLVQTDNFAELKKIDKGTLAIKILEMLTPGGSEFYNDPLRCYNSIKDRFDSNHRIIVKLTKANKLLHETLIENT